MAKNQDKDVEYDEYKVKVARRDKDGNDISGDKLGGGGRHRDDGTISAMAYDFQPLDNSDSFDREEAEMQLLQYDYESKLAEQREAAARQEAIEAGIELVDDIFNFLAEHPEVVVAIGKGIRKGATFVGEKAKLVVSKVKQIGKKNTQVAFKENTVKVKEALFEDIGEGEEMTLEEAQAEYIELFKDFLRMKGRAQRLAKAHIVDADVKTIDVNQFIETMNSLSQKYPALLDEGVQTTVFDMLDSLKNEKEKAAILTELNINR